VIHDIKALNRIQVFPAFVDKVFCIACSISLFPFLSIEASRPVYVGAQILEKILDPAKCLKQAIENPLP
jgi:hypothetical protein